MFYVFRTTRLVFRKKGKKMNRKKVYFSLFVLVSIALLVYSVVDRYNKELSKELTSYSWRLSVLLDYTFLLCFFVFYQCLFYGRTRFSKKKEGQSHSVFFRLRGRLYKADLLLELLLVLFTSLFWFSFDSCANEKIVFSWSQVVYIGLMFLSHFGFCYCLWIGYFSD